MPQCNLCVILPQAFAVFYLRLNFGFQYIYVKRLGYVVIGSFVQPFYDGGSEGLGSEQYDRYARSGRIAFYPVAHFVTLHAGHHYIGQY